MAKCRECGADWEIENQANPGPCPSCQKLSYVRQRCEGCVVSTLDSAMESPSGILFCQASKIMNDIDWGLGAVHDLANISPAICNAIRQIKTQQLAFRDESMKVS